MKILAIHGPHIGGCEYHRLVGPMAHLAKHYPNVDIHFGADLADYRMADLLPYRAVLVHRSITSIPSLFDVVEHQLRQLPELKLIVDTDDDWNLPPTDPRHDEWETFGISEMIERSLRMASQVWTTNHLLADRIKAVNQNVYIVPNAIDTQLAMWRVAPGKVKSNRYRIGIFCQPTHWENIKRLKTGLRRVLNHDSDTDIVCIGVERGHQNMVRHLLGLSIKDPVIFRERLPVDEYADHYRNIDILLAPLQNDDFNATRSNLKVWEAAASQTPAIFENWGPYSTKWPGMLQVNDWHNLHKHVRKHRELVKLTELKPTYAECQALRYELLTAK